MDITEWLDEHGIDIDDLPYCWNVCGGHIKTPWGTVEMPYGFLSDGASVVADLVPDAFFAHDKLYKLPYVTQHTADGHAHKRRLNRFQVDLLYGWLLLRWKRVVFALVRPVGLIVANTLPCSPWARYRRGEAVMGPEMWEAHCARNYIIPNAYKWSLPTRYTRDAVWRPQNTNAR